jgi:predicted CoA-substrate-specific enzyme activase
MTTQNKKIHIGFDIGSVSIDTVIMDSNKKILNTKYTYTHGQPFVVLYDIFQEILSEYPEELILQIAVTGTGGKIGADLLNGHFVNEIIAQSSSVSQLYPEVKTIIEMGGEDSKLILMDSKESIAQSQLSDFSMNSLCAAGTGSFLDQQASRIGVSIDTEFGELALKSENPPRIAGRCSVFAKSDMIHLQQIATPIHDIVAGLCYAVARNYKSTLGRGKTLEKPILFQGGVAANKGMRKAFADILNLEDSELIIPEHYACMGAIGALYHTLENEKSETKQFQGLSKLSEYLSKDKRDSQHLEQLEESKAVYNKDIIDISAKTEKVPVYLGLDIGSLSTNLVLIDEHTNVVARRYLPTASKPLDAIRRGLDEIQKEIGDKVHVKAAGTTGSGRYLTGDFIGADTIQNEITAQATAAISYDPTVDTIFEIGGQDSKYIRIENGVVVDFEMNKVCAAGTGSFLEEQAEKLNINIKEEFGSLALSSKTPAKLGDRCTVFMDSDLNAQKQKGESTQNLVGGLAYSIVYNYINRVVGNRKIGDKIFFQGGVTNNKAVVAAFEKVTGKQIIIPPHFDVTGAIGAAILARKEIQETQKETRFKGFEVSKIPYSVDKFTCKACSNYCEIRRIKIEGEPKPLFFGGRCDKYEVEERKGKGEGIPNLFEERERILENNFVQEEKKNRISIGIPRGLMIYFQQFPFWRTFFEELDFHIVVSKPTDKSTITRSIELLASETCFPVEVMHGHIDNLLEQNVDYIFSPFIVNAKGNSSNPTNNPNCPWVQSYPFMVRAAYHDEKIKDKFLIPTLHFRWFDNVLVKELSSFMKAQFGIKKSKVKQAISKADEAQMTFEKTLTKRGSEILANLPKDKQALVIFGRPYNTTDPNLNLGLAEKLINLNVLPIPLDFLPLHEINVFDDYPMMYWPNGQKIIAGAKYVRKHPDLFGVYMSNFRCGPDSFLKHFVYHEMKNKPYLNLEVDEHGADAGMITRCEAFLDSLKGYKQNQENSETPSQNTEKINVKHSQSTEGRTLYFPYMRDTGFVISAASRHCGIDAHSLPMQNERDIELARKYTSGDECFPLICTTGSFLKKLIDDKANPKKTAFFMPDHNGPCRFGEYNKLQRITFDMLGFEDAKIISPSNDDAYANISGGQSSKFRIAAWKGMVAVDLLRKLLQERRPYEKEKGETNAVYKEYLDKIIHSVEHGAKDSIDIMESAAKRFSQIPVYTDYRKPVIPIVGEIFMRDNAFCSGNIVERIEELGGETIMAPLSEWLSYSTYRYWRDSMWKQDMLGMCKAKIQDISQKVMAKKLHKTVEDIAEMEREIHIKEMISRCSPYIHKDYDGDPPLAFGTVSALTKTQISGVINVLPFSCMPGTLISSVSQIFRKNHNNIPWENITFDGQEDASIDTRLQAFMHQAKEYSKLHEYDIPRVW